MTIGNDLKLHVVKIGHGGTFRPSGEVRTAPADVDAIFAHLKATGAERLTLYFHGGLNPTEKGLAVAAAMKTAYGIASHPVTFVWETGFIETVRQNFRTLSAGDLFQSALEHVIGAASARIGGEAGERGPAPQLAPDKIEAELNVEEPFANFTPAGTPPGAVLGDDDGDELLLEELEVEFGAEVEADPRLEGFRNGTDPDVRRVDPTFHRQTAAAGGDRGLITTALLAKSLAMITWRVIRRHWTGRNHGFYPTVVEEVLRELFVADGVKWVWDGMKTKAAQMWRPNTGRTGLDQYVGSYFLDRLAEFQAERPGLIVDVVGHSAGAIALCHLLAAAPQRPSVKVRRVVFLAPACTVDQFHREVVSQPGRFHDFRMFALRDDQERTDRLVPYVYPWSLLYFVAGALEASAGEPILGMERSLLGLPTHASAEMGQVLAYLQAPGLTRVVWAGKPGPQGAMSMARTHGAFDDDHSTLESLRWLAAH